jgi:hypothetical protein
VANLIKYTNALVYADGALIAEQSSVKISRKSGAIPVHTTAKGLSGFAQGAAETSISIESGVPLADFELDPGKYMKFGKTITITIQAAGKSLKCKGQVMEDSFSHSANSASSLSFEFLGGPSSWE